MEQHFDSLIERARASGVAHAADRIKGNDLQIVILPSGAPRYFVNGFMQTRSDAARQLEG